MMCYEGGRCKELARRAKWQALVLTSGPTLTAVSPYDEPSLSKAMHIRNP